MRLVAFVTLFALVGCQSAPPSQTGQTGGTVAETPAAPFHMDYDTEQNLDFFLQPESLEFLASGGPYYISPNTLPMPAFEEYGKLKQAKVDEAVQLTEQLFQDSRELSAQIREYELSLFSMLGVAVGGDSEFGDLTTDNVHERATYASQEAIISAYIKSLNQTSDDSYVFATMEYHKTMLALELGQTVLDDFTSLLLNAAQVDALLQGSSNPTISAALATFNQSMESVKASQELVDRILETSAQLDIALRQLATADYYLALTSVEYLKGEIPKVKEALESVTVSEAFTEEDIVFAKDYVEAYEILTEELEDRLNSLADKDQLLLEPQISFLPRAHADFWSYYNSAKSTLSTAASMAKTGALKTAEFGWDVTKTAFKGAQRVVGSTVEGASAITKSTFDFYTGVYYGNSLVEIGERQRQNYASWWDKTKNGTAGGETLRTGVKILEKSEELVGDIVSAPIKYTWGEGYVSWAVGGVSKMAAGALTSLGKGTFKLANPQSTNEDLFWGAFDVGTSVIGGSSSVVKASQVTKAGSSTGKNLVDQGANFLARLFNKGKATKLADRMDEIKTLLKEGDLTKEGVDLLKKELKQSRYELNRLKNVREGLEEGAQSLKEELATAASNLKEKTKDLVKSNASDQAENIQKLFREEIESSVKAYLKKFVDPIKSPADIFDNYVHGELDKWLAQTGKDFVSQSVIPWLMGSYDGVYSGIWSSHGSSFPVTLNVADSVISGSGTLNLQAGGMAVSSTLTINGTVDPKGNISGTIGQSATVGGVAQGAGSGAGSFSGKIEDNTMTFNYSGSGTTTVSAGGFSATGSGGDSGTVVLTRQ